MEKQGKLYWLDETFNKRMTETMTAFEYTDAKVDDEKKRI